MRHFLVLMLLLHITTQTLRGEDKASAAAMVSRIQRADYEGDRATLKKLYDDLAVFTEDKAIGSRVHYWRGFALWRRALNGFNESADHADLEKDLTLALGEFQKAAEASASADAQSAAASCLQNLAFLHFVEKDAGPARDFREKSLPLLAAAETTEPENPRVLWVMGASRWYSPAEQGGGHEAAIATYEMGLKFAQQHKSSGNDPFKPSWGEPELLMNLAWASAHATSPNLKLAEQYANSALEIVPYWHYVRDILLPQIRAAMKIDQASPR